jgi:hypothetical protein
VYIGVEPKSADSLAHTHSTLVCINLVPQARAVSVASIGIQAGGWVGG